ncbi:site-2 protease family protein [Pseudarthrobacter sp. J1738]|uniref:site-2 protease family protein n=1 Tax=unclassified Pseudarthrobacter TaxID=2647000 RepID=UPI003D2C0EBE
MSAPEHTTNSREGIHLGRIAGVPIILAYSWFIIAALTVIMFGPVLQRGMPHLGAGAYLVAFSYSVLLLLSVLAHELAHALTARIFGWPTEKIVLNLWGGHTQFDVFTATPGKSVVVALAGPAANFILAGGAWLFVSTANPSGVAGVLANIFVWANFVIAIFNVLPGIPLDGGRIVESIVWKTTGSHERGTIAAGWAGRIIVVGILLWFVVLPLLRGDGLDFSFGIISILVAWFLWSGASAAINHAKMRLRLPAISAASLSVPAIGVPNSATVADVLRMNDGGSLAVVLCAPDGKPQGVVDDAALAGVPAQSQASTPVTAVSFALSPGAYVPGAAAGEDLVHYLAKLEGRDYAVIDDAGRVTGLLRQQTVVSAITGKTVGKRNNQARR